MNIKAKEFTEEYEKEIKPILEKWETLGENKKSDIIAEHILNGKKENGEYTFIYGKSKHNFFYDWIGIGKIITELCRISPEWPPLELYFGRDVDNQLWWHFTIIRGMAHWKFIAKDQRDAVTLCALSYLEKENVI